METILLPAQAASVTKRSRAIALGYFDGVHIGHRAVLARALYDYGGTVPAVFTFDALAGKPEGGLLTTAAEREALLAAAGIEELFEAEFQKFAGLSPEQFVDRILRELLTAAVVCCGEDFRFGAGAAGDVALLKKLATAAGIGVVTVPPVLADGVPVSASRIRRLIAAGEMRQANRLLGYPYTLRSEVAYGRQLGRTLGTPTINQPLPAGKAAPKFGVYAAAVAVPESGEWRVASLFCGKRGEGIDSAAIKSNQKSAGTIMGGVCNIGVKPTVGAAAPIAETWIENFTGNLYGMTVPVTPVVYL
ncbi:MAG: hypothetical protein FWE80_07955, partial [Oscillospiraceae bacterium]|nr:hypothetical protein [Oscillospiraceae bacterium]